MIDEITNAISDGRLQPNQKVNETRIAKEMGLSKSPVREAIQDLVKDGILTSEPFKGTVVKGLSKKEVGELYSLRAVLESFAVELAIPRLTKEDIRILETIVSGMESAADTGQKEQLFEDDLMFHRQLVKFAGHAILLDVWKSISIRIKIIIRQKGNMFSDIKDIASLHRLLIELIKNGRPKQVQEALKEHIHNHSKLIETFFKDL